MNEQKRPVPAAGEKRDERRPSGGQNGQGRSYAGKSADRRTDRPQGDAFRKDEKRPYDGKTASGPRKFDGERRPQTSGDRSDRPYGRPAPGSLTGTVSNAPSRPGTALLTKRPTGLLPADPLPASLLMGSLLLISLLLANLLMESLLTASPPAPGSLPRLHSPAPASWR